MGMWVRVHRSSLLPASLVSAGAQGCVDLEKREPSILGLGCNHFKGRGVFVRGLT